MHMYAKWAKKSLDDNLLGSSYKKILMTVVNACFEKSEWGCCLDYSTCSMVSRN